MRGWNQTMQTTSDADASPVTDDFIDRLAAVQARVADAIPGYDTLMKRCEPEIEHVVRDFREAHERHNHELCARLQMLAKEPDANGSFFSTINRAVVEARAVFSEVGTNVLPQVLSGEAKILELYASAALAAGIVPDQDLLERHIEELQRLGQQVRLTAQV